jgi:serine/threonine protein kinase
LNWKLCDFGCTAEGTSKEFRSSNRQRGTVGYCAPELEKHGQYNNKADVFALGCIMYELATNGIKAFKDGYAVRDYSEGRSQIHLPLSISRRWKHVWQGYLDQMLAIEPAARPSIRQLQQGFEVYRSISLAETCLEERTVDEALEIYDTVKKITSTRLDERSSKNMEIAYKKRPLIATDGSENATTAGLHDSDVNMYPCPQHRR